MISTRSVGLVIDTVVCLTLDKWETVSGQFGGYLTGPFRKLARKTQQDYIQIIKKLAAFLGRSPDRATFEDLRSAACGRERRRHPDGRR
jgi:hypothetical protein